MNEFDEWWKTTDMAKLRSIPKSMTDAFKEMAEAGWNAALNALNVKPQELKKCHDCMKQKEDVDEIREYADKNGDITRRDLCVDCMQKRYGDGGDCS